MCSYNTCKYILLKAAKKWKFHSIIYLFDWQYSDYAEMRDDNSNDTISKSLMISKNTKNAPNTFIMLVRHLYTFQLLVYGALIEYPFWQELLRLSFTLLQPSIEGPAIPLSLLNALMSRFGSRNFIHV